jgi:glycosyltransferase involved in cell wall biosynthesis
LAHARNSGILATAATYILPLDADDYLAPLFLEKSIQVLTTNKNLRVVYTDATRFGSVNEPWLHPAFDLKLLCKQNIFQPCAMFAREAFNQTKGYRGNMVHGYEDWDFWLQLIEDNRQVFHVKEPLFYYRVKNNSMLKTLQSDSEKLEQMKQQVYLNNRKKIQQVYPEFAYWWEQKISTKDLPFMIGYRLKKQMQKIKQGLSFQPGSGSAH